jgi:O-Antigen ligase
MRSSRSRVSWRSMSGEGALALPEGQATYSSGIVEGPAPGRILIRKRTYDDIVNVWLILAMLVGALISVADGLTRVSIFDREEAWNGPLEYVPYQGAFLFAGLTFPLMIAYARKARVELTEGLFLWFVFCTAAYTRDFSYIRWPGTPLFITDVVLIILLISIYLFRRPRFSRIPLPVTTLLVLFLGAGALAAARGFWGHHDAMVVLRDSALVGYTLFLLVGYHLFRSWLSIKRMAVCFLLGTGLGALNGLAWFISAPQERRFIYYGIYILVSLAGTVVAMACGLLRPRVGWIFVGVLCFGLMLANARSLFVSLAILLLVALLAGGFLYRKFRFAHLISILVTTVVMLTLAAFLFLRTEAGHDFAERSTEELASGVLNSSEDTNWRFRLSAWEEAWRRFSEYPLGGEGFGVPFTFDGLAFDNDPRPHNTFLTVLYKMGVTGFLPLAALLVYSLSVSIRAARCNLGSRRVALLHIVVLAQLAFILYGAANLMLESPFLAGLFWTMMGLGLRVVRMLDLQRWMPRAACGH